MRKTIPFTNTIALAKIPNRIDALQVYYDSYYHFIESNLEPIPNACDLALKKSKANEQLKAIKLKILFVLKSIRKISTAVRMDLTSIKVSKSSFELGTWLETLLDNFHTMYNFDNEVMLYIKESLAITRIQSDTIMLSQVITHLLRNAYRFSEEGTTVKLKCRESGDQLVIEVHNTGTISTENKENLFVPYFKGEAEMRDAGFGLYLCTLYIEALNGSINVCCENNITIFSITLHGAIQHYTPKVPDI